MNESPFLPEDDTRLTAYAFGELSGEEAAEVEALLRDNPAARATVAELQRIAESMKGALAAEPVPVRRAVMAFPGSRPRKPARTTALWASLGLAASLAIAASVALHTRRSSAPAAEEDSLSVVKLAPFEVTGVQAKALPGAAAELKTVARKDEIEAPMQKQTAAAMVARASFTANNGSSTVTLGNLAGQMGGVKGGIATGGAVTLDAFAVTAAPRPASVPTDSFDPVRLNLNGSLPSNPESLDYTFDRKFAFRPNSLVDPKFVLWAIPRFAGFTALGAAATDQNLHYYTPDPGFLRGVSALDQNGDHRTPSPRFAKTRATDASALFDQLPVVPVEFSAKLDPQIDLFTPPPPSMLRFMEGKPSVPALPLSNEVKAEGGTQH